MAHPRHELDEAFQTPVRFSIMAALGSQNELSFSALRDLIEAEDSALSKAVSYLEKSGHVKVTKGYVSNRPRTWVAPTSKGRHAFRRHVAALQAIVGGLPAGDDPA